ncbi:hypothetical protein KQY27_01330 [Methanobrevibacter sp. TMH8]|uniref:hypothetical protein n=1 Tax=Methanobrevibacter sp. TMH8 TaxID=2848611 RepID=UPI001CCAA9BE|nr:hypothetical protein [Methanobrevibacter sp. TMH8]MBZ9570190.1 hypothetical protein [Methanobrevibacter sp. TMH8]
MLMRKNIRILYLALILTVLFALTMNTTFATDITNSTDDGGILVLAPGNYTGSNNKGITINKNVTIQGNGSANQIIIDAQGTNNIFNILLCCNVTIINITFINSNATSGGAII